MATFITAQSVGQDINIYAETSTGYWKYNHDGTDSSVFSNGNQTITVANANGEFTIIPCDSDGTVSGDLTELNLYNNQLTSFDSTGLSSLTGLGLSGNQLTSFDGTDLSSLTHLQLNSNQLTSFDSTGLSSLTNLDLGGNQLTSFDGTGLSDLTVLNLDSNQLTSFDLTGLTSLIQLTLSSNQLTPSVNDQILNQLNQNGLSGIQYLSAEFYSTGGRTSASNADYDNLLNNLGWYFEGLDLASNPTFITSKSVGQDINIEVQTSTGYWKYNHNGTYSSVFSNGGQTITVANANGEFTIIPCLSDGTVSGNITNLDLQNNQLTSFDGTGLTSLIELGLGGNQLTLFDGTDLSSLTYLGLNNNQLTSFDGTDLSSLTTLYLDNNQLTSFDGTGLSSLTTLGLGNNSLTSFDGTDLTSLTELYLNGNQLTLLEIEDLTSLNNLNLDGNQLTSFDGTGLTSLTNLGLGNNSFTSFDGTGLSSLTTLGLGNNSLTSFDGTDLTSLNNLNLDGNQLTSFDGTGLTSLTELILVNNLLTSLDVSSLTNLTGLYLHTDKEGSNPMTPESNNSILSQLDNNGLSNGNFLTINGRTSAGTADYDALIAKGWTLSGLDLTEGGGGGVNVTGKLRIKGATTVGSGGGLPPQWDGGTIYNIGAVVTHEGQTWNCIQYAPAGYGPFGGYIDVYWTLQGGGGTTTTTTTEAPTTTTTTTIPSLYWDSIELGSVDANGDLPLNIDFTEYGFDDLSNSAGIKTALVIPSTGPSIGATRVIIDGVEYAIILLSYFDNGFSNGIPSQDPSIGTFNPELLQNFVSVGRVMTTDQVKLAVIQQSGGSKKGVANTYITDSLSSTIGTVQDILDLIPTTTTTTASGF